MPTVIVARGSMSLHSSSTWISGSGVGQLCSLASSSEASLRPIGHGLCLTLALGRIGARRLNRNALIIDCAADCSIPVSSAPVASLLVDPRIGFIQIVPRLDTVKGVCKNALSSCL